MCNEEILLNQDDFECVGDVAIHCDLKKLCIAISEAQNFDLYNLFCEHWSEIVDIWNEVELYQQAYADYLERLQDEESECVEPLKPENYDLKLQLICGGNYTDCRGRTKMQLGVKRILVYYSYARYLITNGFNDTANGGVTKTNEFSMPIPLKELEQRSNHYRDMGKRTYEKVINFICLNRELLNYDGKCDGCGCGDDNCGNKTTNKGFGYKSKIIRRELR